MLCSEIETSSLSHPFSSSFALLSLLLATPSFPFFHISHISVYISPRIRPYRSHSPHLFPSLSQIVCHLCDQWSSFFSGNSAMMDFFLCRAVSALYFLEGGGGVGGQFAAVHESFEWSRGKVMFWCFFVKHSSISDTLSRSTVASGKRLQKYFTRVLDAQPEEFPKQHLFVQERQKPQARKIAGLVSDQTDGGKRGVCSCHALQIRRKGTKRPFWSTFDTFSFGIVWQPLKLTDKFNRAVSCLCVNMSITNLMCLCVFTQQLAVEDSVVATSLVFQRVTGLNTLTDGYSYHADLKESSHHVCSCFPCLPLIKYNNLSQYLTNTITSGADTIVASLYLSLSLETRLAVLLTFFLPFSFLLSYTLHCVLIIGCVCVCVCVCVYVCVCVFVCTWK